MTTPTPVPEKRWVKILFWPGVILIGLPAVSIWGLFHLVALNFACNCTGIGSSDWTTGSRVFGALMIGVPVLLADWFVWWKWRDHRRKEKWAAAYTAKHLPPYAQPQPEQKELRSEDDK